MSFLKPLLPGVLIFASIFFPSVQSQPAHSTRTTSGNPVSNELFTCVAKDILSCYRKGDTKPLWNNSSINDTRGLVLSDQYLFLTQHKDLLKIDIKDGEFIHRFSHAAILFDPVIYSNHLILSDHQGGITALNRDDFKIIWQRKLDEGWVYPPSLHKSVLFSGGQSGTVWALNLEDGKLLWHKLLNQELVYRPIVHQGNLIVSTFDGIIQNLSPLNGNIMWKRKLKSPVINLQTDNSDRIVASGFDGKLYAVDVASGNLQWQTQAHASARFNFLSGPQMIASIDHSGRFKLFDSHSGELTKAFNFEGNHQASPLLMNSSIWLFPDKGPVVKINPGKNY